MDHGSILVFVPQTRRLEHSVSVPALQQWSRPMSNNATVHFRAMPAGSQALGTTGLHSHVSHGLRVLALRRHGWSPRCPSEAESGLQFLSSNVLSACRRSAFCGRDGGPPYSRKVRQRPQHQPSTRPTSCAAQMLSDSRHRVWTRVCKQEVLVRCQVRRMVRPRALAGWPDRTFGVVLAGAGRTVSPTKNSHCRTPDMSSNRSDRNGRSLSFSLIRRRPAGFGERCGRPG